MLPKSWPNALFLSFRTEPLKKTRSRQARSSLIRRLMVLLSVFVLLTAKRALAPARDWVPPTSFAPHAWVPLINSLLNKPLTLVVDLRPSIGVNAADRVPFAV